MDIEPDDADRYPTLSDVGRLMLERLREHPAAPIYRNRSGNRLLVSDIEPLREFERATLNATIDWQPGRTTNSTLRSALDWPLGWKPSWVHDVMARAFDTVPHYRALGTVPRRLEDVAPIGRAELAADIARFVPDTVPTARLINFSTTGTTGHRLLIASHPVVAARYLAFHKRALRRVGVTLRHGRGEVGVVLIGFQRQCFTYVSVTPLMHESGLAKINLHPDDWRDPTDRARYLNDLSPEVIAGDPISFAELLTLPLDVRPAALISVSMALYAGLRTRLEARFACPVLDVYSLNEVGPVGVWDANEGGHVLLQPRLYVETLDTDGRNVGPGERGEITVTGGFNFCLPLLRYRTGDFGVLAQGSDGPVIRDLVGRPPVRFRGQDQRWFNNIDVSHALAPLPLSRFGLHQARDGSLELRLAAAEMVHAPRAVTILESLFGAVPVRAAPLDAADKIVQYTTDLEGALA